MSLINPVGSVHKGGVWEVASIDKGNSTYLTNSQSISLWHETEQFY